MDVDKEIAYWRTGSEEDFEVASELVAHKRPSYGLFFAHLAAEKMLKAHVAKASGAKPPRIHNLPRLAELSKLEISDELDEFLRRLNGYQLECRYPDTFGATELRSDHVADLMKKTKDTLQWLKSRL